jgi:hypothetical protein
MPFPGLAASTAPRPLVNGGQPFNEIDRGDDL